MSTGGQCLSASVFSEGLPPKTLTLGVERDLPSRPIGFNYGSSAVGFDFIPRPKPQPRQALTIRRLNQALDDSMHLLDLASISPTGVSADRLGMEDVDRVLLGQQRLGEHGPVEAGILHAYTSRPGYSPESRRSGSGWEPIGSFAENRPHDSPRSGFADAGDLHEVELRPS